MTRLDRPFCFGVATALPAGGAFENATVSFPQRPARVREKRNTSVAQGGRRGSGRCDSGRRLSRLTWPSADCPYSAAGRRQIRRLLSRTRQGSRFYCTKEIIIGTALTRRWHSSPRPCRRGWHSGLRESAVDARPSQDTAKTWVSQGRHLGLSLPGQATRGCLGQTDRPGLGTPAGSSAVQRRSAHVVQRSETARKASALVRSLVCTCLFAEVWMKFLKSRDK